MRALVKPVDYEVQELLLVVLLVAFEVGENETNTWGQLESQL